MEWITALLSHGIIRILTTVKSGLEFGVTEHFVSLVDLGHLFLRLLLGDPFADGLVRVMFFGQASVGLLDGALVRVLCDAEDFVVVLLFGAFEGDLGFL